MSGSSGTSGWNLPRTSNPRQPQSPFAASAPGERTIPAPIGTGRPNQPQSQPGVAQLYGPQYARPADLSSSAAFAYAPGFVSPISRQSAENMSALEYGIQMGRLESDVNKLREDINFLGRDAKRYKMERDDARQELTQAKEQIRFLEGQINALKGRVAKLQTPELSYRTPTQRRVSLSGNPDRRSVSSGTSLMSASGKSPGIFSPKPELALAPRQAQASPASSTSTAGEVLGILFQKLEDWAVEYATETIPPLNTIPAAASLHQLCFQMCKDSNFDDLVQKLSLRKHLVVAILNHYLVQYLGAGFLDKMEPMARNGGLLEIKGELGKISPQKPLDYFEVLRRRVEIVRVITQEPGYAAFQENRVVELTEQLISLLSIFIPSQSMATARDSLLDLVRECLKIGQRMVKSTQEWALSTGVAGERWDRFSMLQKDESMRFDPKLTENNGFLFVVRLGITPSITQKEYNTGILTVKEIQKMAVFVKDKPPGKTPPSGRR